MFAFLDFCAAGEVEDWQHLKQVLEKCSAYLTAPRDGEQRSYWPKQTRGLCGRQT